MGALTRLASYGAAAMTGATAVIVYQELQKPVGARFTRARRFANERADPLLLQLGLVGGQLSQLACIEHVGRKTGTIHRTPVYPRLTDDSVVIALPYGEASQWAQNVVVAGHCRMQYHETLYELDEPAIVTPSELGGLPAPVKHRAERLGLRYLRLRRAGEVPGTFASREAATLVPGLTGAPTEPPIEGTFRIPVGPRMVAGTAEPTPASEPISVTPRSAAASAPTTSPVSDRASDTDEAVAEPEHAPA